MVAEYQKYLQGYFQVAELSVETGDWSCHQKGLLNFSEQMMKQEAVVMVQRFQLMEEKVLTVVR